jgi:hypothetical protein
MTENERREIRMWAIGEVQVPVDGNRNIGEATTELIEAAKAVEKYVCGD